MDFTLRLLISGLAALVPIDNTDDMWVLLVNATDPQTKVCGYEEYLPVHSAVLTFRTENFVDYCEQISEFPDRWYCHCPCRPCPGCEANEDCSPHCWCPWPPEFWTAKPTALFYDTDGRTLTHIPIHGYTIEIQEPQQPAPASVKEKKTIFPGDKKPNIFGWSTEDVRWLGRMKDVLGNKFVMPKTMANPSLSASLLLESGRLSAGRLSRDTTGSLIVWNCPKAHEQPKVHEQVLAQELEARLGEYKEQVEILLHPFDKSLRTKRLVLRPTAPGEEIKVAISNLPAPHFPSSSTPRSVELHHFYWYYTLLIDTEGSRTLANYLGDDCPIPSLESSTKAAPMDMVSTEGSKGASSALSTRGRASGASETCPLIRF